MTTDERVKRAEEQTNTSPSEGQKRSGNYKKGKITLLGFQVSIENPKGSIRAGVDESGNQWQSEMKFTYGYFRGTVGKDGDPIDVYLGDKLNEKFDVYIVDQVDEKSKAFDEHKVMFGFGSEEEAKQAYISCYEDGWQGFGNITTISLLKFRNWIGNKDAIKYPASKLNMSSRLDFKNVQVEDGIHLIKMSGEVIDDETLLDLQKQAGDLKGAESLIVEIASPGGSVAEGLQIMMWLDQLSQSGVQVITVVTANAYSIASLIMLAADVRMISTHGEVMVHNPMVPQLEYANANELEQYVVELRQLEALMYEIYQVYTGLETEQIKALMDNETFLSPDEAVKSGFADMVVDIEPKPYVEAVNIKKQISMSKMVNVLRKVIAKVNGSDFVNQLYYTDEGGEIEISQEDASTYQVGDKASAEDGEVKLADGSKLTIEGGVITEIDKAIEEEVVEDEAAEMPAEEEAAIEPIEEEAAGDFNEGPAPEEEMVDEEVEVEASEATEVAEEVIEEMEGEAAPEVEAPMGVEGGDVEIEIETSPEEEMPMEEAPIAPTPVEDATAGSELVKKYSKLEQKIAEIEKEKMEILERFNALAIQVEKLEAKAKDISQFEEVATEAIESIAKNTSSNFQPEAKSAAKHNVNAGLSIFQRMKAERGLK